jgi:hypothetical protein
LRPVSALLATSRSAMSTCVALRSARNNIVMWLPAPEKRFHLCVCRHARHAACHLVDLDILYRLRELVAGLQQAHSHHPASRSTSPHARWYMAQEKGQAVLRISPEVDVSEWRPALDICLRTGDQLDNVASDGHCGAACTRSLTDILALPKPPTATSSLANVREQYTASAERARRLS